MQASESSSGSSSATTSASARETSDKAASDKTASPESSEAGLLAREADDAKVAMGKAWGDIKHALTNTADLRLWTKQYPWIAAGTAVVAGFAAGYVLVPRDKDEAAEMWEKLKAKLTPSGDPGTVEVEPTNGGTQPKSSLFGTILREGIKAVAPLITSMVGSAMGTQGAPMAEGQAKPTADARPAGPPLNDV